MKIFFSDPRSQNISLEKKLINVFRKSLYQQNYILGNYNNKFEKNLKKYFKTKHAVCVNSGTDALKIAIKSLNLNDNTEIIIPSLTATATGTAVLEAGGKPVLVDVDETGNICPKNLKKMISKNTKAVIVVHLHGNVADMIKIKKIVKKIPIIEDCAQSFGSKFYNKKVGTFGKLACFSFYPTKNLSAMGDGGAIITNDNNLHKRIIALRQYGWNKKRISFIGGYNSRLDEIQAAILDLKLKSINKNNLLRNKIAEQYIKNFKGLPITFPKKLDKIFHSYHLFVILTKKRNKLLNYLRLKKIFPSIHYKVPLHKMPTFKKYKKSSMKYAIQMSNTMISLPIYPELTNAQQQRVIRTIQNFFKSQK